ncbi:MAG: hypothetical protein JO284_10110 [Planctomycetaceae bacterium]|nr:hypothetical protein [Planctomycetaceae bacterium]MBV8268390.1 hypothetical protein [Planctomycetaceae bacterium]MBV8318577.1 hypothetical protein [Planctomycetaceae bacterium]MBV8382562.1 hypothetical protein [Planctomycetaceae bacterium]
MGFTEARKKAVEALRSGRFQSEPEGVVKGKNLLGTGEISSADVIDLLHRCRGPQHSSNPHHFNADITVHVFQPVMNQVQWYIKLYFITYEDADVMFMSVHKSVHGRG